MESKFLWVNERLTAKHGDMPITWREAHFRPSARQNAEFRPSLTAAFGREAGDSVSGTSGDEQAFAESKSEVCARALRLQRRLHRRGDFRQHGAQQRLHCPIVAARPGLEIHRLVNLLFMLDRKASLLQCVPPFLHRPGTQVAWVTEALKGIDVVADASFRHDIVDQCEQALRLEHAMNLAEEIGN